MGSDISAETVGESGTDTVALGVSILPGSIGVSSPFGNDPDSTTTIQAQSQTWYRRGYSFAR